MVNHSLLLTSLNDKFPHPTPYKDVTLYRPYIFSRDPQAHRNCVSEPRVFLIRVIPYIYM